MKRYSLLNLEQGSQAWLDMRMDYITASQVPSLFDLSPYQSKRQLFDEKLNKVSPAVTQTQEFLFNRGHRAEEKGRIWVRENLGLNFVKAVAVSVHAPMILASLDGIEEEENAIFEAKYMGKKKLDLVREGKIPSYHNCQIQAQFAVTGADKCIYFAMDGTDAAYAEILPDPQFISKIKTEVMKFVIGLHEGTPPAFSGEVFKVRKTR